MASNASYGSAYLLPYALVVTPFAQKVGHLGSRPS